MAMLPIIADTDFTRLCLIDDYVSFIWTARYYEPGDFELSVPLSSADLPYLQLGNYVLRDDAQDVGIIERREVTKDITDSEIMVVSGRFLSSILGRRIIATQTQVSGTIAQCVTKLLNQNAISPTDTARKLPLSIGALDIPATQMRQQFTGTNLLDVITNISKANQIGYRVTLDANNQMIFGMYTGVDRSYSQSANTYAVFSTEYGNLESADYVEDTSEAATNVLVAGEGEGTARKTVWATKGNARGLARYELYQDARNASTNNGEISDSVYLEQLRDEGLESVRDMAQMFAGNVNFSGIEYGTDFYVGDVCTIESVRWGIYVDARLVEIIESTDETGLYTITPTFDIGTAAGEQERDTSAYLMSESSLDLLTEQGLGPLMAENTTFDAAHSEYDHAVKISELDEITSIDDAHLFAVSTANDTRKATLATLWQAIADKVSGIAAAKTHKHAASDITSGTLAASHGGTGSTAFGSILTEDISSNVSVPNSTWTTLGSVELAAGDWIVSYNVSFASNATGRRAMVLHTSGGANTANLRQGGVQVMAVSGGGTYLNGCRVLHLTSAYTYHLNVLQTSGAALNTTGYIRAFRLK